MHVRPKKSLGQHFLRNEAVARQIADAIRHTDAAVLEIGPGMGILTRYLLERPFADFSAIEVDEEAVGYLKVRFPELGPKLIAGDFLKYDIASHCPGPLAVAGNFPYNISSQILFKVLEHKEKVVEVVGMFQKETAERVASPPGNRQYGILSVLLQAFYDIEYLFTVNESEFIPPPKVKSAVIRLRRNGRRRLDCDEELFKRVVKTCFNMRRKTIRNSIRPLLSEYTLAGTGTDFLNMRPEQLSVEMFVELTCCLHRLPAPAI